MSKVENQDEINTDEDFDVTEPAEKTDGAKVEVEAQAVLAAEETKARETGWVEKEKFRGDPKNWRPATEWNEYGDKHIPFIKAELRGTKEKLSVIENENKRLNSVVDKMTTVQDKIADDFYDKNLAELNEQELKAVEDGDTEAFQRIREQKEKIKKPAPVAVDNGDSEQTQPPPMHPEAVKFMEANPWFNDDPQLQEYAIYVGKGLNEQNDAVAEPGQEKAFYAKVEQKVKATFAHKFKNPNQDKSDIVESRIRGGDTPETDNGAKGWDDLPPEAKQQCKKLMAEDDGYTKEEYIKYYPFDEE